MTQQWPSARRIQLYALIVLTALLSMLARFVYDNFFSDLESAKPARDFIAFWAASKLTLAGHPESAYTFANMISVIEETVGYRKGFAWLYPPTFLTFVAPLSLLDYKIAYLVFMLATFLIFIYAARLIAPDRKYLLAILAFPAIYTVFIYGQNSLLTAALAILALHWLPSRPLLAGACIGLLALKPQMAALFPLALLVGRQWQALAACAATFLVTVAISIGLFGTDSWIAFLHASGDPRLWLESGLLSWEKMISTFAAARQLGASIPLAYALHALVALSFLGAMLLVWHRSRDPALRGASLAIACLACTPYAYEYELTWLAIPLLLLSRHGETRGWLPLQREILTLAWLFPLINLALNIGEGEQVSLAVPVEAALMYLVIRAMLAETRTAGASR